MYNTGFCPQSCVVLDIAPADEMESYLLASYTSNTWQGERGMQEKIADTGIGKRGENAFQVYVLLYLLGVSYEPYDEFRTDGFRNHAPFDGIFYLDTPAAKAVAMKVKEYVTAYCNQYGHIPDSLRAYMRSKGVYSVEIKTTRIGARHRRNAFDDYDYGNIAEAIRHDDFLLYPKFCRNTENVSSEIRDFDDYVDYSVSYAMEHCHPELLAPDREGIREQLISSEIRSAPDIAVRVYIDEKTDKAYLMGYVPSEELLRKMHVKKMPREKSKNAIYFTMPISEGRPLAELMAGGEFWRRRENTRNLCPVIGNTAVQSRFSTGRMRR